MPKSFGKLLAVVAATMATTALAQADATQVLRDVPGFDFGRLPAPAKKELASVLTDEFDFCGRPLTLLATLKKGDACRHTKRLVSLAAQRVNDGVTASEVLVELGRYQQSFGAKRTKFTVDERQCLGPKDAKVTLVEFSDFECPYCAAARPLLEALVKSKQSTRLCWAPFPLQGHAHATLAGQAALFARDGGKFWAMHDALFDNQLSLSEPFIKGLVKSLGLDVAAFSKALASNAYVDELTASKEVGRVAGVDSTPTVFINGRKLTLGLSAETFALAVDDELDWVSGGNAWPGN